MPLALSAVAMGMLGVRVGLDDLVAICLVSLLGALFVAPWLTMACRNPLAGAVFALRHTRL